jgi:hypothetical protein
MLRAAQPHSGHKQPARRSCAISERAGRSHFAAPSLSCPLTPLFPLHTRHSSVSPLFPLHTQKHGGGGCYPHGNVSKICRRADIFVSRATKGDGHLEGGRYKGDKNPRSDLPGEEPGRTHRGRPATTQEGTMVRAPTRGKVGGSTCDGRKSIGLRALTPGLKPWLPKRGGEIREFLFLGSLYV